MTDLTTQIEELERLREELTGENDQRSYQVTYTRYEKLLDSIMPALLAAAREGINLHSSAVVPVAVTSLIKARAALKEISEQDDPEVSRNMAKLALERIGEGEKLQ